MSVPSEIIIHGKNISKSFSEVQNMVTTVPEFRLGREVRTSTRRTGGTEQRTVEGHRLCKQVCCNVVGKHFLSEKIWSSVQPDVSVRRLCGPLIPCLPTRRYGSELCSGEYCVPVACIVQCYSPITWVANSAPQLVTQPGLW